jgi:hypothetical protein
MKHVNGQTRLHHYAGMKGFWLGICKTSESKLCFLSHSLYRLKLWPIHSCTTDGHFNGCSQGIGMCLKMYWKPHESSGVFREQRSMADSEKF